MYLAVNLPYCTLYPSSRVAEGVVMGYYDPMQHCKPTEDQLIQHASHIVDLFVRFGRSITWRNVFIFTRVPYCVRDPHSNFFKDFVLPPIKENKEKIEFEQVASVDMGVLNDIVIPQGYGALEVLKVPNVEIVEEEWSHAAVEYVVEKFAAYGFQRLHYEVHKVLSIREGNEVLMDWYRTRPSLLRTVLRYLDNQLIPRESQSDKIFFSYSNI